LPTSFIEAWDAFLVLPLQSILVYLEGYLGPGLAIISFTILSRAVLFPLTIAQTRSMQRMQALQPQLAALKTKYAKDRQKLNEETMALYKEAGVNPAAGCLPLLIQMPIMFALYGAISGAASNEDSDFARPWLWLEALNKPDVVHLFGVALPFILPILAAITQFIQQQMMTQPTDDPAQRQQQQMMQFMPLMMLWIGTSVSSGLGLYWVTQNIVGIVQQYFTTGLGSLATFRFPSFGRGSAVTEAPVGQLTRERQAMRGPRAGGGSPGGGKRSGGKS
jgi:YidC/Oxa1 family membrane protein insertase